MKRDVFVLLKQDRGAYCSTMVDLYGLGAGFPAILRRIVSQTSIRCGMSNRR